MGLTTAVSSITVILWVLVGCSAAGLIMFVVGPKGRLLRFESEHAPRSNIGSTDTLVTAAAAVLADDNYAAFE